MIGQSESLKVSRYVQMYDLNAGSAVLANLFWQTYLELNAGEAEHWRAVQSTGNIETLPGALRAHLAEQKMLLDPSVEELSIMDELYTQRRFTPEVLGLTIAPTIDCNFACPYCYEDKRPGRITPEVEQQIVEYVERYLPGRKILNVIWYGGEPLMCKEAVYRLSEHFVRLAGVNRCEYKARMVTNGYLLTPEVTDNFAKIGHWRNIQLTLDGSAAWHDVKRPLKSGKATFQRIYQNLSYAATRLPISLRMNVDLLNPEGCHQLLDEMAADGLAQDVFVYFAPIHGFGKGCRDIAEKADVKLASTETFGPIQTALTDRATRLGFATAMPSETSYLPQCQATSTHSVVIEPDGSLHRCWVEVGEDSKRVGHISHAVDLSSTLSSRWLQFHPVRSEPCRSCEVLPLCFGGCAQRHLDGAQDKAACDAIRHNTKEQVFAEYIAKHGIQLDPEIAARRDAVRPAVPAHGPNGLVVISNAKRKSMSIGCN